MTRSLLLLGFCSLAMAQSPAPGLTPFSSSPVDWRFAQPDADMKIGINFQALLKSDAVAKAIEQGKAQAKDNAAQIDFALAMLRTIDRVSVSAHQQNTNDMDVLAEVTGSFDPQLITGFFPSTGKSQVKAVGPHTLLIGEGDSFAHAVERMSGAPAPTPTNDLQQSDIWIQADAKMFAQQSAQPMPPMLQNLRGLAMGLTLSESPVVDLILNTTDDAAANGLLQTLQLMSGPMLAAASPQLASVGKALTFKQDGSNLRMHLVVPPEALAMLQQQAASAGDGILSQIAPMMGGLGIGGAAASTSKPPVHSAEPPPQNGGKIKIYGLDDGTKEISAPK